MLQEAHVQIHKYTLGHLQAAVETGPSGNEHSSAHRQLLVDVFVAFLASVISKRCVDMSDAASNQPFVHKRTVHRHMKRVHGLDRLASIPAMCHKKQFASQRHSCNLASFQKEHNFRVHALST